jgi:hypothetical protein
MSVLCIASTAIDITPVHVPEVGHDIKVLFNHISREITIYLARVENRLH